MMTDSRELDFLAHRIAFEAKAEDIRRGKFLPKTGDLVVGYPPYTDDWQTCASRWTSDMMTEIANLQASNVHCFSRETAAAFEKACNVDPSDADMSLLIAKIGADIRRQGKDRAPPVVTDALLRAQYYLCHVSDDRHYSMIVARECFRRFEESEDLYAALQAFLLGMRLQAGKLSDAMTGHSAICRLCDLFELDAESDQVQARAERKAQSEAAEEHAKASVEGRASIIRRTHRKLKNIFDEDILPEPAEKGVRRHSVVLEDDIPHFVDETDLAAEREKAEDSKARRRVLEAFKRPSPATHPEPLPEAPGIVVIPEGKEYGKQTRMLAGKRLPLVRGNEPSDVRSALLEEFPYAEEAVDALCRDLVGKAFARIRPTMLHGYAGAGKTRLARRFAELAGLPSLVYAASSTADSSWSGTSKQWSSARISIPLQTTVSWAQANGVIIVDEADKCGESRTNGRFSDALLPFLERESSSRIFDPALECEVNLSGHSYILTCNELYQVPAPLRDRCRIVKIGHPKREHLPQIARTMVADLRADRELDEVWMPDLDGDELEMLAKRWKGGSMRALARIVDLVVTSRDALATRN